MQPRFPILTTRIEMMGKYMSPRSDDEKTGWFSHPDLSTAFAACVAIAGFFWWFSTWTESVDGRFMRVEASQEIQNKQISDLDGSIDKIEARVNDQTTATVRLETNLNHMRQDIQEMKQENKDGFAELNKLIRSLFDQSTK